MHDDYELQEQFDTLEFYVVWSIRYHQAREWFYEKIDWIADFLTLFLTTASVYKLLSSTTDEKVVGGVLVVATASGLFRRLAHIPEKLSRHKTIAVQLGELRQEISTLRQRDENAVRRLTSRYRSIQNTAPPTLPLLTDVCFNQTVVELERDPSTMVELNWLQRVFAHLGNFGYQSPPSRRGSLQDIAVNPFVRESGEKL